MSITIALYRGRQSGRLSSRLLAWWQRCDYSHCAVLWQVHEGRAYVSDATLAHGVSTRWIEWRPELWHLYELDADREHVAEWWHGQQGQGYDWIGLAGFLWRRIKGLSTAYWCSEGVMASIGMADPWRWDVGLLSCYLRRHGGWVNTT